MSGMSEQQLAEIRAQLGDAQPATHGLLASCAKSVADMRGHDHTTQREDWFCMNLAAYMGEHAGPVLRRLLDAEARVAELEAERHTTNEALSEAAEAIREKDARLAAVRDAVAEAFMCPDEDCDGHLPKLEQILGGLDLLREAEAGGPRG